MFRLSKPGMRIREEQKSHGVSSSSKVDKKKICLPGMPALCLFASSFFSCAPVPSSGALIIMASTPKGMDVVGLDNGSHGRSCEQHGVCGSFVLVDDILYCKWAVQTFDEDGDTPEACIQVYKLARDGHVGCHVGYLPRRVVKASRDKDGEKDGE
jgi:hypothetical protein